MAQEFTINSSAIESKINQLLPSQGGFGAGVDFSASTMVIPIVDLTETASGSNLRSDLQRAFGIKSEVFSVSNSTTTFITTTGYFRLIGFYRSEGTSSTTGKIQITDGTTTKDIIDVGANVSQTILPIDLTIFLGAGDSCVGVAQANCKITLSSRQVADINGNLVNP